MLYTHLERRTNAPVAGIAGGYGAGHTGTQSEEFDGTVRASDASFTGVLNASAAQNALRNRAEPGMAVRPVTQTEWPVLATFLAGLILPIGYLVASISGWVDWLAWLPVALSAGFVAWVSAIRINESGRPSESNQ